MWESVKEENRKRIVSRYELLGDAWLALDGIGEIEEDTVNLEKDKLRKIIFENENYCLYVKPHFSAVFKISIRHFNNNSFLEARIESLEDMTIEQLKALLLIASK